MNILYIAPRYHTNQTPIIKGWIENGDTVKFISQYVGKTEDYRMLSPDILGYSSIFKGINWLYTHLINRKMKESANVFAFEMKCGFPPIFRLNRKMREFRPDVVIMRERSVYNMMAYFLCKVNRYKAVLYNQSPLWSEEPIKNDLSHKLVRKCTPPKRMTPVMGERTERSRKEEGSFFVPFVVEKKTLFQDKKYFQGDKINLLCVAKYETRKNLLMLLEIMSKLKEEFPITLTIIGEVSTSHHKNYYQKVKNYVEEQELTESVCLLQNKSMAEVEYAYEKADAFILPSTKEVASISQLEAMAYALPVICSNTNGAACYIEDEKNGYLFEDNNQNALASKLRLLLEDKEKLKKMGEYSQQLVIQHYSFLNYKQKIQELL